MITLPEGWDLDSRGQRRKAAGWDALSEHEVRLGSAFHEAGHAVMALRYGGELIQVWSGSVPPPDGAAFAYTGCTNWRASDITWRSVAVVDAAGSRAHAFYLKDMRLWCPEYADLVDAPHDRQDAIDHAGSCGAFLTVHGRVPDGVAGARWCDIEATADEELRAVWPQVCSLAVELSARERLAGAEVTDLIGTVQEGRAV